jgi:hypothetical protein
MKIAHYIIANNGDGTQRIEWYKNSDWTAEQLIKYAEKDKYDTYASGDGVQINTVYFPDSVNLDEVMGIYWEATAPGFYV